MMKDKARPLYTECETRLVLVELTGTAWKSQAQEDSIQICVDKFNLSRPHADHFLCIR